jgi:hypothetical protein
MMGMGGPDPNVAALRDLGHLDVISEARERFRACSEWESIYRNRFLEDLKFAEADSFNGYQWPDSIRHTRDLADRPCLTLNIVRQHNLKIINDMKRSKESCKILGMGNGATQESANVLKAIIRHIEYTSKAQRNAYTVARNFQVKCGIGWWRIITDYESNDSFDQEIYIEGVPDPLSVFMDPDCQEADCSDGRYAFVFSFLPRDLVQALVPDYPWEVGAPKMPIGIAPGESFFIEKDHWLVCEYFRKVPVEDKLISFVTPGTGERLSVKASMVPPSVRQSLEADVRTMTRRIVDQQIEWKLIVGDEVVDETIWPGKYIPLIRVLGEETVIEGMLDRKGHTRALQDAQRMFNYNASAQVEFGALQTKAPWVAPAASIEGLEGMWNTANTENHSVLVWKHVDDDNPEMQIPPPQRTDPPQLSPAFQQGMDTAFQQMMMTSGQWQNQQGQMGNERTGAAIEQRLQQGEVSTYHFVDNYEDALVYTYQQIIDLVPQVYDTRRIKHILADDGIEMEVTIDPGLQQAYLQQQDADNNIIARIFNPQLGKYEVAADVGPNLQSKRREAVEALTTILTEAPGLTAIVGDIMLRNMEFDDAAEAAMRLRRMVPPQALGQGPTQNEQQMQQTIQQLQNSLAQSIQKQGRSELRLAGRDQMRDIDVYSAETDRFKALSQVITASDPESMRPIIEQLVGDALETNLMPILKQNIEGVAEQSVGADAMGANTNAGANGGGGGPPIPGAQQATDGEWYITDPTRRGRYLKIGPLAVQRPVPGTTGS